MRYVPKHLLLLSLFFFALAAAWGQAPCINPPQIDSTVPCPAAEGPVCGCDGVTYHNACQAENWHGVTDWAPGPCAASCDASFMYTFLAGNTVVFYNSSSNYTNFEWIIDGQVISPPDSNLTLIHTLTSDTSLVCLLVWNQEGCQDAECLLVYPGAPEEMCNVTDCVWPGDANGNGQANNYDLLNIGLGFGISGPGRPFFPDTSDHIAWLPNYGQNWLESAGPVNYKHLDCDGDGFIDEMDAEAIEHNYTPDFGFTSFPVENAPPVYLEFEEAEVYITNGSASYLQLNASLYVGSSAEPVSGLHGMALYLNYPDGLTAPYSVSVDYENNSFFGNASNVLNIGHDLLDYNLGRYDLAFSRKNDDGATGFGKVASVSFIVSADIIEGRAGTDTPFTISLGGILLIGPDGNSMEYSSRDDATVRIINTITANGKEEKEPAGLKVFPNPASTTLFLQFGAEYEFNFKSSDRLDRAFQNGAFFYGLGFGICFQ